ncbi:hypothetical protein A3Q56_05138 [Intoshia linei]|uniref:Vacuolar protein sorting-associated protein 52 homolog n=1 Tax=Intoshia linei TaxID=1819745 RepID=A0A177B0K6_9BILA|nr:hypothetical protein A3Q56_05138 [Intoshia linei]
MGLEEELSKIVISHNIDTSLNLLDEETDNEKVDCSLLKDVLNYEDDLRDFSEKVKNELEDVENISIKDYINEARNIITLHKQLVQYDNFLHETENILFGFRNNLGKLRSDISKLQTQSSKLDLKMKNRQDARYHLTEFLSCFVVKEDAIKCIFEDEVLSVRFQDNIKDLDMKLNYLNILIDRKAQCSSEMTDYDSQCSSNDLLGVDPSKKKSPFTNVKNSPSKGGAFSIGDRLSILQEDIDSPVIILEPNQDVKHLDEVIFRSNVFCFLDNSASEYVFSREFFNFDNMTAIEFFTSIMEDSLLYQNKQLDLFVSDSYDLIFLILCLILLNRFRDIILKHNLAILSSFWTIANEKIWNRIHELTNLNIKSLRAINTQTLSNVELKPHYITRRFAELSTAICLMNENLNEDKVDNVVMIIYNEYHNFILRLAAELNERSSQIILLINNYEVILAVFRERATKPHKIYVELEQVFMQRNGEFIDETLSPYIGPIIRLVKQYEAIESSQEKQSELISTKIKQIVHLINNVNENWKIWLDKMRNTTIKSFTNLYTASKILQLNHNSS